MANQVHSIHPPRKRRRRALRRPLLSTEYVNFILSFNYIHYFPAGGFVLLIRKRGEVDMLADLCVEIVGWGNTPTEASFGGGGNDAASVKGKLVNLISSVRTWMGS